MKSNPAKICVPVCVSRASALPAAIERAAALADLIELRLDYLDEPERGPALEIIRHWLGSNDQTVILTFRPAEQGGRVVCNLEDRFRFWCSLIDLSDHAWFDLEFDLVLRFAGRSTPAIDWHRIICSHHDFREVPSEIELIYERMAATPARVLKLAVQAKDAGDCLPIFGLLEIARSEGRELIGIAMGQAGFMTRVLGPARGSFLTYGSIDNAGANAPGQPTVKELRQLYRVDKLDQQTRIFGLVGNPVGHSLSPQIHNAAFQAARINAVYLPFEVSGLDQFMSRMVDPRSRELDWNLCGLSVTAPHKSAVMAALDWTDPPAKSMGAINTIIVREGEMLGYNTDAAGFLAPLKQKFGTLQGANCAVIGAGGGARAACWALQNEGSEVSVFVRDPGRIGDLSSGLAAACYSLSSASFEDFDIVVNATPLGTYGALVDETPATTAQFRGVRLAYDLVYNPPETRFLREARAAGCETLGGIEMLLAQAVEQFKLWTGIEPDVEVMRGAALKPLAF